MNSLSCVIVAVFAIAKVSGSYEQFDETAWMDTTGRDKYFEYSEMTPPAPIGFPKHSNNIDVIQFVESKTRRPTKRRLTKKQHPNVVDMFLNTIRKFVAPDDIRRPVNEPTKGLDIKFDESTHIAAPTFGNKQDLKLILVGTKWCGAGNVAKNNEDIGYFYMTDACCREHDLCPMVLEAKQSNFGLKNSGKFTRSHCDCDEQLFRCLKSVNSLVSIQLGLVYFNVLGPQCFREDYPMKCKKQRHNRCIHYEKDETASKKFQWIDNKWF